MRRPIVIQQDLERIGTIQDLTSIFEVIASIHISQIKDRVVSSTKFFNELWGVYSQLRSGEDDQMLSIQRNGRTALVVITSDGGLIGDIDERLVREMQKHDVGDKTDVYAIGAHGAQLLSQRGVKIAKVFMAPNIEKGESVHELAKVFGAYERVTVYYQTYLSLMRQETATIDLFSVVQHLGKGSVDEKDLITSHTYILEPSPKEIISYMEAVMVEIALGQVVLESKLAQYASRFNAMYAAKSKAKEMRDDLALMLHRAKRASGDERIKEILSGMKMLKKREAK
ncbi:MAG TPA: F0F1 ATP synthase subunit gamma [Candidatus Saccharimonadia bacterium]